MGGKAQDEVINEKAASVWQIEEWERRVVSLKVSLVNVAMELPGQIVSLSGILDRGGISGTVQELIPI